MSDGGACAHIEAVTAVKHAKKHVCDECVKIGGTWVHLRTCQECGGTHCCDNSPNRHATKHAKATKHPVIASANPASDGSIAIRMTRLPSISRCPRVLQQSLRRGRARRP